MIEKHVIGGFKVASVFQGNQKIAGFYEPEEYVPPEIVEFAASVRPDPRFCFVHVIAMSDGPHYGANMNGDWFSQEELCGMQTPQEALKNKGDWRGVPVQRIKTFEQARYYRNHDNRPSSPYYGDVPLAVWNDRMFRVELVIRVFREALAECPGSVGAPDLASDFDRGNTRRLSMGCTIHHEQCRYCHAENELIKDRCVHLKHHMNEIMPDGKVVCADNFGVGFFDISDIPGTQADPVATSVGKIAGFGGFGGFGGFAGSSGHAVRAARRKNSAEDKAAEITKEIPAAASDMPPGAPCPAFSSDDILAMGGMESALSALAAAGITLTPEEFLELSRQGGTCPAHLDPECADPDVVRDLAACPQAGRDVPLDALPKFAARHGLEAAAAYAWYRTALSDIPPAKLARARWRFGVPH